MPIDPADRVADENRQAEIKRTERGDERAREQRAQAFQAQYKGALQQKKAADLVQRKNERPDLNKNSAEASQDKERVLFHKIVEAVKGQDQKTDKDSQASKKAFDSGQDDLEWDKLKTADREADKPKVKGEHDEGHKRVDAKEHQEEAGDDGNQQRHSDEDKGGGSGSGSQGFGEGGSGGAGSGNSGSGGGFSGDSSRQNDNPLFTLRQEFEALQRSGSTKSSSGGSFSGQGGLRQEILDEMVSSIELTLKAGQAQEMELTLTDKAYAGLRFRVVKSAQGIHITFICPTNAIKKQLLLDRPSIYAQLKQKAIRVHRIDIL